MDHGLLAAGPADVTRINRQRLKRLKGLIRRATRRYFLRKPENFF